MVARRGNAPRSAGCEPVALLLSYRANEEVAPAPGNAPGSADRESAVLLLHHAGVSVPGESRTRIRSFRRGSLSVC